jgi:replication factor A1
MGAIEEVYEDLEADVTEEDFRAAVEEKVAQMGGLADEETAALLVAHEYDDDGGGVDAIADIEAGMEEVEFKGKVTHVGELRTFERDGEDDDGRVINLDVADESGSIRVAFWDGEAVAIADGEIERGDVLKLRGRPKEGYAGVEVNADRADIDEEAEIEIDDTETHIGDLVAGQSEVTLEGLVLETESVRTFDRDDGSEGRVAGAVLGDETARVRLTLWDEQASLVESIEAGTSVAVIDGYVRERDGDLELHVGSRGAVERIEADVEYDPDTTDIEDLELEDQADVRGVVRSTDPVRTFDRDDGSEGQVRNVRIQDDTGDIRVALWGEKAERDIAPGDEVVFTDVEIQEGWEDDIEASAGWQSTVSVLGEPDGARSGELDETARTGRSDAQDAGLSDFAGESAPSSQSAAEETPASGTAGADSGNLAGAEQESSGEVAGTESELEPPGEKSASEEITGTVLQGGNPVIVDPPDGDPIPVVCEETFEPGTTVAVTGSRRDGRLDATGIRRVEPAGE